MNITLTLTAGLGADLGPNFNLTANVGSVTPSTATKTELTNGISVSVDNAATQVTITSTGTCTNALTLNISGIPATTTTTTTTTTTAAPTYSYLGKSSPDAASSATACSTYSSTRGYTSLKSSLASIVVSDIFYDAYPSTPTNGGGNWIALKAGGVGDAYSFQIDASGVVTAVGGNCSGGTTTTTTAATTTTTTAAPAGSFTVKNTSGSGQIDDVVTTGGAAFFFFNFGTFPVTIGQQADGGGASLTSAPIFVDVSNYLSTSCLSLYINGGLSGQLEVSANGTYTFTNKTFTSSDVVLIEYVSGVCA